MDYADIYREGYYRYMLGGPYEDYIARSVDKIMDRAGGAQTALSVGCGDGSIEAAIGDRLDLTLHDVHAAAAEAHPELHWVPHLPNGQYDFVYAHGAVFACVPHEDKQRFVDDLAARVVDGGTLYLCGGYSKQERVCRAKVYSIDGKTVSLAKTAKGPDWQQITTHIWGVNKINVIYYTADISEFWAKHQDRIHCTS